MRVIQERAGAGLRALGLAIGMVVLSGSAALAAQADDAVFGLRNLAGEAAIATPLPDGTYRAGGALFTVRAGLLHPAEDLAGATPGRYHLVAATDGADVQQDLILKVQARCISSSDELRRILKLPTAEKSGLTVCLNPGRYLDMTGPDFADVFLEPESRAPITFEAANPEARPVLNFWMMRSTNPDQPNGGVILRDLDFVLEDIPELPLGTPGFVGVRAALLLSAAGETRGMLMERLHIRGSLGQGREGQPELERSLFGLRGHRLHNVIIRDSRFEGIVNAMALGGTNILIEGNRMRHSWGDFLRISPQLTGGTSCAETRGVTVRNNILSHPWTNNRLHPDFVHFFAANHVSCDVRDVLIEGNIAFPGRVGLIQPGHPPELLSTAPKPVPAQLPSDDRVLHRLVGPGQTALPAPVCDKETKLHVGVQRDVFSTGPVEVLAPGSSMRWGTTRFSSILLTEPGEAWSFRCRTNGQGGAGYWHAQPSLPYMQGIFSNGLPGPAAYHGITVRHNILWVTAPAGVSFRDNGDRRIAVVANSLLLPWPGDLNGDGRPNEFKDGFNPVFNSGLVMMGAETQHVIRRNVMGNPNPHGDASNDAELRQDDGGRRVVERFTLKPGGVFSPETATEAVSLARPRADGVLAGREVGAVGVTPRDDPYDWGWVRDW